MTLSKFVKLFRERLKDKLSSKTGWGRNELLDLVNDIIDDLLLEALEGVGE